MLRRGARILIDPELMTRLLPEGKPIKFPSWEWTGSDMVRITAKESEPELQALLKTLDLAGGAIHFAEYRYELARIVLSVEHPRLPTVPENMVVPELTVRIMNDVVVLT